MPLHGNAFPLSFFGCLFSYFSMLPKAGDDSGESKNCLRAQNFPFNRHSHFHFDYQYWTSEKQTHGPNFGFFYVYLIRTLFVLLLIHFDNVLFLVVTVFYTALSCRCISLLGLIENCCLQYQSCWQVDQTKRRKTTNW